MPPDYSTEGLAAARVIQRDFPQTAVVVLSAHVEVDHAMDLLSSGHRTGYLLKSRVTDVTEFIDTLKRVERAGAGGPGPDGEGAVERGDRAGLVGHRGNGRKARAEHLDEAAVAGDRRGSSSGAGGSCLPGRALTERLLLAAMRAMALAGKMVE